MGMTLSRLVLFFLFSFFSFSFVVAIVRYSETKLSQVERCRDFLPFFPLCLPFFHQLLAPIAQKYRTSALSGHLISMTPNINSFIAIYRFYGNGIFSRQMLQMPK